MTKVLRTESHRMRSLEGSKCGPSHLAALSFGGGRSPANHCDDSELQPFVTNSFSSRDGSRQFVVERAYYPCPRRAGARLGRLPGSTSLVSLWTVGAGLAPDLCSGGVRSGRRLIDGAGGFLPGVPLGCLATAVTFETPAHAVRGFIKPTHESNAGRRGGVPPSGRREPWRWPWRRGEAQATVIAAPGNHPRGGFPMPRLCGTVGSDSNGGKNPRMTLILRTMKKHMGWRMQRMIMPSWMGKSLLGASTKKFTGIPGGAGRSTRARTRRHRRIMASPKL
jgi:hypothetical protein